jgi:ribosome-binding ATPase YchF (GTP1/OBG family)
MILMLLRCFDDTDKSIITHVDGSVDPVRDLETIETELLLADMQTLSKRSGNKKAELWSAATEKALIARILAALDKCVPARDLMLTEEEVPIFRHLHLLTGKPLLVACNVPETQVNGNSYTSKVRMRTGHTHTRSWQTSKMHTRTMSNKACMQRHAETCTNMPEHKTPL